MAEKNIFIYKVLLLLNISDYFRLSNIFVKIATPLKNISPLFSSNVPLKVEVLSRPPFLKSWQEVQPPLKNCVRVSPLKVHRVGQNTRTFFSVLIFSDLIAFNFVCCCAESFANFITSQLISNASLRMVTLKHASFTATITDIKL